VQQTRKTAWSPALSIALGPVPKALPMPNAWMPLPGVLGPVGLPYYQYQ